MAAGGASSSGQLGDESVGTTTPSPAAQADPVAIIGRRCSTCHTADQALAYRAGSAAEAQGLIDQMKQRGALLTPEEEQTLVRYFTR